MRQFDDGAESSCSSRRAAASIKKTRARRRTRTRAAAASSPSNLDEGDELIGAARTDGSQEVILATRAARRSASPRARCARWAARRGRVGHPPRRTATRSSGWRSSRRGATLLTVCENGYGKRTPLEDYRVQNRGGKGIITIRTSERNGNVVGVRLVVDDDQVMLITDGGKVIRCRVSRHLDRWAATRRACASWSSRGGEKIVSVAKLAERDEAADTEVQPERRCRRPRTPRGGARARRRGRRRGRAEPGRATTAATPATSDEE